MKYLFGFVIGHQFLYGSEVLVTAEAQAKEMAMELSKMLIHPFIYNVTVETNQELSSMMVMNPDDDVGARVMVRAT